MSVIWKERRGRDRSASKGKKIKERHTDSAAYAKDGDVGVVGVEGDGSVGACSACYLSAGDDLGRHCGCEGGGEGREDES
jgi:hypothetical protein